MYGWAFFFERTPPPAVVEQPGYLNVCLYCGTAQPAAGAPRTYPYTRPLSKHGVEAGNRLLTRAAPIGAAMPIRAATGVPFGSGALVPRLD